MRRKYYLIDTENVGDRWFKLSAKTRKKDRIVTFYTENHSKRFEKYLSKQVHNHKILWLECVPGSNALDYQLMGALSYLIAKHPKSSFCIFSNDKGFQETVAFWKQRGIDICQKEFQIKKKKEKKEKKSSDTKKKKQTLQKAELSISEKTKDLNPGKLSGEQYVTEIAKSLDASNLSGWYQTLVAILGQENGRAWYLKIKEDHELRKKLCKSRVNNKQGRGVHLVKTALQAHGLNVARAAEAYKIIQSHNKENLKAISAEFDKKFGQNPPQKYYKALKPLIRVLKENL